MSDIQSAFLQLIFNLQAKEYSCNYLDSVITITFFLKSVYFLLLGNLMRFCLEFEISLLQSTCSFCKYMA